MILFNKIKNIINGISEKVIKFIDNVILDIEEKNNPKLKPIKIEVSENRRGS